jgi:hypothetical protein
MTLLEQLKGDCSKLSELIKAHRELVQDLPFDKHTSKMLHDVYLETLEDALKTASSLPDYLKKQD